MSIIKQENQNAIEPLLSGPLFGSQRPKSRKKLLAIRCNRNIYSTAISIIKRPRSASCRPKADLVLLYTSIKQPGKFKAGRFQSDQGKRTTVWKRSCFFGFCLRYGPYCNHHCSTFSPLTSFYFFNSTMLKVVL